MSVLLEYLRRDFLLQFGRCEAEWVAPAEVAYERCREALRTDVAVCDVVLDGQKDFDAAFFEAAETSASLDGIFNYRLSHQIFLTDPQHPALKYLAALMRRKHAMEIYYSSEIAPGFKIMHGAGTVIGPRHRIGRGFTVYQGVTLGQKRRAAGEFITIGDGCTVFAGAKVLGMVRIGDNVRIGANAVLLGDAESDSTYAGAPAVKVR